MRERNKSIPATLRQRLSLDELAFCAKYGITPKEAKAMHEILKLLLDSVKPTPDASPFRGSELSIGAVPRSESG
jgi:hypothetical protein